jgi:two-component system phosphate regulon sensor histidine kinase PhoR
MNDVHFTNVMVNVLENAIKYSPDVPNIDVYTENIKDMILIKVQDRGLGMSKIAQKSFLKSFIENTLIYTM